MALYEKNCGAKTAAPIAKESAVDCEITRAEKALAALHEAIAELDVRLANVSHPSVQTSANQGTGQVDAGCSSTLQGRLSTNARQIEAACSRIRYAIEQLDI